MTMLTREEDRTGCVLLETAGFRVVRIADGMIEVTRPYRRRWGGTLLGVLVFCSACGLDFAAIDHMRGLVVDLPVRFIGYLAMVFLGVIGSLFLFSVFGLIRESWRVTHNLVTYRDGLFRRNASERTVELQKDDTTGKCVLSATRVLGSSLFWDKQYFDLTGTIAEKASLGRLVAQFSGWRYVETDVELGRSPGEH